MSIGNRKRSILPEFLTATSGNNLFDQTDEKMRKNTEKQALKILEAQIIWLSWHCHQVTINKSLLDFE